MKKPGTFPPLPLGKYIRGAILGAMFMAAAIMQTIGGADGAEYLSPAEELYVLTSKLAKLPISDEAPLMEFAESEKMGELCHKPTQQGIKACQIGEHIYLDGTVQWSDPVNQSVLVHEFVHHLHWLSHGPAMSCEENVDREIRAYQIQNEFLYRTGHDLIQTPSFAGICKEK